MRKRALVGLCWACHRVVTTLYPTAGNVFDLLNWPRH